MLTPLFKCLITKTTINFKGLEGTSAPAINIHLCPPLQVVWLVFQPSLAPSVQVPAALSSKMLAATRYPVLPDLLHCLLRLHLDIDLDERVQYILNNYEYICKVGLACPVCQPPLGRD